MKEEQTQHHHQQYGGGGDMTDLRQFFYTGPTHNLPTAHQSLFSSAPLPHHYDDVSMMLAMGGRVTSGRGGNINYNVTGSTSTPTNTTSGSFDGGGDGGATARWPRQETLTLLEVRTRLNHKFKEANHKGPLWDELSRIMCQEHGYQRSGKKCKEKFENLYKYYKKTKGGNVGRHDGKHYRFFRQLEALYGETSLTNGNNITNNNTIHIATNEGQCNIISNQDCFQSNCLSNFSPFEFVNTSSSEAEKEGSTEQGESSMDIVMVRIRNKNKRRIWKEKIEEFIDSQMRKMIEKQEAWLENMMRTLEHKEQERVSREEEWRKQETQKMEREHKFWAEERAWIESRDKALMDALHRIIATQEVVVVEKDLSSDDHSCHDHHQKQEKSQEEEESEVEKAKAYNNKDCWSKKRKANWRSKSTNCNYPNNGYNYSEMNSQGGIGLGLQEKCLVSMNESCLRMLHEDGGDQNHL